MLSVSPQGVWKLLKSSAWLPRPLAQPRPQRQPSPHAQAWQQAVHAVYPRVAAPSLCRPAGPCAALRGRAPGPLVLRGLRVYSDERPALGELLELEVLTPEGASITALVRVEAVREHPASAPARYDVAFQVCDLAQSDLAPLRALLQ